MKRSPRVLIWKNKCWESKGSNLGDIAIITAMVEALKKAVPDIRITLLSDDPPYTAALYGIEAERIGIRGILRSVRNADLLVIGGGTVFTDASSMTIIPVNASLPLLARLFRTPTAAYGVATGRMSRLGRFLVRCVCKRLEFCCTRDEDSRRDIAALCPNLGERLLVTEDASFSLLPPSVPAQPRNRIVIAPRRIFHYGNAVLPFYVRRRLGLLPKGYFAKMETFKQILADLADHCVEKHDCDVAFLPMYSAVGEASGVSGYLKANFSSRDDVVCRDIRDRMRHRDRAEIYVSDAPRDVISFLGESRLLVGVPLHSLILSHLAGTPVVGLCYQTKVARFLQRAGLGDYMIDVQDMDSPLRLEEFIAKVERCLENEEHLRGGLRRINAEIRERTDRPARMVRDFFERPRL